MKTFWWNLRFRIAWAILPSNHKHVSVRKVGDYCDECGDEVLPVVHVTPVDDEWCF